MDTNRSAEPDKKPLLATRAASVLVVDKWNGPQIGPLSLPSSSHCRGSPNTGTPLALTAEEFDFWVVDEVDFGRFVGQFVASSWDISESASSHPDKSVRQMFNALGLVMARREERLDGPPLLEAIDRELQRQGSSAAALALLLRGAQLPQERWVDEGHRLPVNIAPALVPVFVEEVDAWLDGKPLNPRIHAVRTDGGDELRVLWRKQLSGHIDADAGPQGYWPPPVFVLDATADPALLSLVLPEADALVRDIEVPEWPAQVHVTQWADDLVSRSSLGLGPNGMWSSGELQRWLLRIEEGLSSAPRDAPLGVVTHKPIESEVVSFLKTKMGFGEVRSRHYGDERGSNELEDVHTLVMLGLPIPNPAAFQEEAQGFLYDQGPLSFDWTRRELHIEMRDGRRVPVRVGGYWDEPVKSYYWQKCQAGLYQTVHRIRPYLVPAGDERRVLIVTNMPVPGVVVEALAGDTGHHLDKASQRLNELLQERGSCKLPELGHAVQHRPNLRWLQRHADMLAAVVNATFTPGARGRAGVFTTR